MKAISGLVIAAMLAATGCSGESESPAPAEETATTAPTSLESETESEAATGTAKAPLANRIPTRFQGVWDYVEGTCSPVSDLRMEISGSEILFYESIGMVTGVTAEGDNVVVSLTMEGEGETWEQDLRLALTGAGETKLLETSDGAMPRASADYLRKRCPAG